MSQLIEKLHEYLVSKKADFITIIKQNLEAWTPTDTGNLLNTMLINLRLDVIGNVIWMATLRPTDYPMIIKNPKRAGAMGNYQDIIKVKAAPAIINNMSVDYPDYDMEMILPADEMHEIQIIVKER